MVLVLDLILATVYAATFFCQTELDWMATSTLSGTALVTILVSDTAFQACLAGGQLPRLFCAGGQLHLTKSLYSSY